MSDKKEAGRKLAEGILRFRWIVAIVVAVALVPAWFGITRLRMDSSNESFLPKGDPVTANNNRFKEIFGSEEFFFILVETDNIWTPANLAAIDRLTADIEENLPFVDEVMSVTNADLMSEEDGFLNIDTIRDAGLPEDAAAIDGYRKRLEASQLYRDRILSDNPSETGILVSMKPMPAIVYARVGKGYTPFSGKFASREQAVMADDIAAEPGSDGGWQRLEDPRKATAATLLVILADHETDGFSLKATGMPVIDRGVDKMTGSESGLFGLLSLLAAALILFVLYRDVRSVIAPLVIFALTALLLFGLMGWLGMKINLMTIVLVPLLLVISVGYSVHIMNGTRRFVLEGFTRKEAVRESLAANLWPCFLSAVTTAAGLLSFLFVPMAPIRDLGFQCGTGTMLTWVLAMTLVPVFYIPGRTKTLNPVETQTAKGKTPLKPGTRWTRWNDFLFRRKLPITLVFILVTVLSLAGSFGLVPGVEMLKMIGDRADFVEDTYYISDRMGGAYSTEFLITLPEAEMAKDPGVLKTLKKAGDLALTRPHVNITFSLADMILELDRVLGDPSDGIAIPADRDTVAQYLLLYEMSGGESLESWTDLEYRTIRMSVVLGGRFEGFDDFGNEVETYLLDNLPAGSTVVMTGDIPAMVRMLTLIVDGQIISCLAALGFIGLLLIVVLRSLRLGLIAVVPNIFPIVTTLGLMGVLGWSIDFVTVMVAPMLIGIAVDDTIHYFVQFRKVRKQSGGDPQEISGKTFRNIGNSLVFTSVILAGGFALFSFSKMASLQHMGILAAWGISWALLADLAMSPLLISFFYRNKKTAAAEDNLLKEAQ